MGVRSYELVIERRPVAKAPNKRKIEEMIESGEIPVYEGETIVSIKEKQPDRATLDVPASAYTPRNVMKRGAKTDPVPSSIEQVAASTNVSTSVDVGRDGDEIGVVIHVPEGARANVVPLRRKE